MLTIRRRNQWNAMPAKREVTAQATVREVFIHHTENETHGKTLTLAQQDAAMRSIQAFHMGPERGWSDIGYHFVIFPGARNQARVYAGRRLGIVPAAQLGHNQGTVAIAMYSGGADPVVPHARFLVEQLLTEMQNPRSGPGLEGPLPRFRLTTVGTHRQVSSTSCPGDIVAAAVPTIARAVGLRVYNGGKGL